MSIFTSSAVALEFVVWIACFAIFRIVQRRLCRRYPGIRTVCRVVFLSTAVVAVAPALWVLVAGARQVHLLGLVNHVFGMGVLLQTSLRSLLLLRWLPWGGHTVHATGVAGELPLFGMRAEAELVGFLAALSATTLPKTRPEPRH